MSDKAKNNEPEQPKVPTLQEQLAGINYKDLQGDAFKKYLAIVEGLKWNDQHDFVCYSAEPIMQQRFQGLPGSPVDMVGIKIKNDTPVNNTRIATRFAKELNTQLRNTGRYYLLKK